MRLVEEKINLWNKFVRKERKGLKFNIIILIF